MYVNERLVNSILIELPCKNLITVA